MSRAIQGCGFCAFWTFFFSMQIPSLREGNILRTITRKYAGYIAKHPEGIIKKVLENQG
jgi:hypothetical protein